MTLLPLPIAPSVFATDILAPALALLPRHLDTPAARVLLTAICLQESAFDGPRGSRWQVVNWARSDVKGPARGLAQFELGTRQSRGGVWGVYLHSASVELLRQLCRDRDVSFEPRAIYEALDDDDMLAIGVARALLLTDPKALPSATPASRAHALAYYLRVWRPGAWERGAAKQRDDLRRKFEANWSKALEANGL